jgi:hypothetical protein
MSGSPETKKLMPVIISILIYIGFETVSGQSRNGSFLDISQEALPEIPIDERVLLSTDRNLYLCGEKITFSVFTYEGNWYLPVSISSVLYVELYSQDNTIISRNKFVLKNSRGSGSITIPRDITSGVYNLRAYTNYMKNFGARQFYLQKLKIVNPLNNTPVFVSPSPGQQNIKCQIHPEGGNLAEGIRNTIGCRFTGIDGKGIPVIANLLDMDNNIISSFKTYKNGFASFKFIPESGNTYKIEAISGNSHQVIKLPEPVANGLYFSVDTLTSESVSINVASADRTFFPLRLNARHGGFVYPVTEILIDSAGVYNVSLQRMPKGLINLELCQPGGNTIASRFIYIQPLEKFEIVLETDKENYRNRDKVNVSVNTTGIKGMPVESDLIIFSYLTKDDLLKNGEAYSDKCILSQELRQIYFDDEDLVSDAATDKKLLDLVLLFTPGNIQTSSRNDSLIYLPEIRGDIITGKLVYKNNKPATGVGILQSFTGKTTWIESAITDKNGNFHFLTNNQKNRGDLILKVQNSVTETSVILDNEFFPDFPLPFKDVFNLSSDEIDLLNSQFINIQIEDAFSTEDKTGNSNMETIAFYGNDYLEFYFPDYAKLPNMKEFIYEVILGAVVVKENRQDVIIIIDKNTTERIGPDPLIILDGIPLTESSVVLDLSPGQVQCVRVIRSKYFYKDQVYDGVLDIITFNGDASSIDIPENTYRFDFLHAEEETIFIEPEILPDNSGKIPLYKNLLLWNSALKTNKEGKAELSFYTPDNTGTFRIKCLGFTQDGLIGEGSTYIIVGE